MLHCVLLFINRRASKVLGGLSPFEVVFGRNAVNPLNALIDRKWMYTAGTIKQHFDSQSSIWDELNEDRQILNIGTSTPRAVFKEGDRVMVLNPLQMPDSTSRNKGQYRSLGFGTILKVFINRKSYDVRLDNFKDPRTFHERFLLRAAMAMDTPEAQSVQELTKSLYLVDTFLDIRKVRDQVQILTKWVSFVKPSWEILDKMIEDVPREVLSFLDNPPTSMSSSKSKLKLIKEARTLLDANVPSHVHMYTDNSIYSKNSKN